MTSVVNAGLVRELFSGDIDVVGDVHGELCALRDLLDRLGYNKHGEHAHGRRLVFLGDLCDRGPDSPGVVRLVQQLVTRDLAQCLAGNHELNLLREERKDGNHWFFGGPDADELRKFGPCASIPRNEQAAILEFFNSLPVVLSREDLRLVHAAWDASAVEEARRSRLGVMEFYRERETRIEDDAEAIELKAEETRDEATYNNRLKDEKANVPLLEGIGRYDEFRQMNNSIKVLTSGVERLAASSFFTSGKWRMVERVPWWQDYADAVPVMFGHYWRWWRPDSRALYGKGEPYLFDGVPQGSWLKTKNSRNAFCLDYSVGVRFKERREGRSANFHGRLAAMRWPERELVFDEKL